MQKPQEGTQLPIPVSNIGHLLAVSHLSIGFKSLLRGIPGRIPPMPGLGAAAAGNLGIGSTMPAEGQLAKLYLTGG